MPGNEARHNFPDPMKHLYESLLRYDSSDWFNAIELLSANIADVDRDATRIWFAFYPLRLQLALDATDDRPGLERKLGLMGRWGLADKIDSSHRFLYGHRYWPQVKAAIGAVAHVPDELPALATAVADAVARDAKVTRDDVVGISAVGLMTLRQAGPEAFAASPGTVHVPDSFARRSPQQVVRARTKDEGQGLLGFLSGVKREWTITFDEQDPAATFTAIEMQEIASASQSDKREYRSKDPRCIPNEGPIPVECRAASCGTCWVGVLGGAERLTPVEPHEAARMKVFGYAQLEVGSQPVIRLACQAKARGAASIVIPPWNGIISRL